MKRTIFRLLSRLGIAALSTSAMAQVAPPVSNGPKTGTTIAADLLAEAAALGFKLEVSGSGPDVLVLHGGAGPASMLGLAKPLAADHRVLLVTHPGFNGTARPLEHASAKNFARLYVKFLERAALYNVLVMGNSLGGWIAAEMAILASPAIAKVVLIDAVGISVPGEPMLDVFSIPPMELANYSFHDSNRFRSDPSKLPPEQLAAMRGNLDTMKILAAPDAMQDPTLRARLKNVRIPALVVWGESDRVVTPAYGRAFAEAFPNGRFIVIPECGHLPQIEQPARLMTAVQSFIVERRTP